MNRRMTAIAVAVVVAAVGPSFALPNKIKLPEVSVKETQVKISPDVRFSLPNAAVNVALGQTKRRTSFGFSSRYDLMDNSLGFELSFMYRLAPYRAGIRVQDRVDFSEFFSNVEHLQRSQSIGPRLVYELGENTSVDAAVSLERTYTTLTRTMEGIESGKNIFAETGITWDSLSDGEDLRPRGSKLSLFLYASLPGLGSDYDYTDAVLTFRRIWPFGERFFDSRIEFGYPLQLSRKPLTGTYLAGGYENLRGYDFKEFRGDSFAYASLAYSIPVEDGAGSGRSSSRRVGIFLDAANVGDPGRYTDLSGFKSSVGVELTSTAVLLRQFPLKISLAVAKAFEPRSPYVYFTFSTHYPRTGK